MHYFYNQTTPSKPNPLLNKEWKLFQSSTTSSNNTKFSPFYRLCVVIRFYRQSLFCINFNTVHITTKSNKIHRVYLIYYFKENSQCCLRLQSAQLPCTSSSNTNFLKKVSLIRKQGSTAEKSASTVLLYCTNTLHSNTGLCSFYIHEQLTTLCNQNNLSVSAYDKKFCVPFYLSILQF